MYLKVHPFMCCRQRGLQLDTYGPMSVAVSSFDDKTVSICKRMGKRLLSIFISIMTLMLIVLNKRKLNLCNPYWRRCNRLAIMSKRRVVSNVFFRNIYLNVAARFATKYPISKWNRYLPTSRLSQDSLGL